MKALAQRRADATVEGLTGTVLCYDVRDAEGKVVGGKGAQLDAATARSVLAAPWDELHVLAIEPGDLHEEEAGARLARAVVGDGVEVKAYTGGQWTLASTRRGLLAIAASALAEINAHEGIAVFTLFHGQPVEPGETVAKAKVTPLVVAEQTMATVEKAARAAGGVLAVRAFRTLTIGAVAREKLEPKQRARFEAALGQKIDWFGSRLLPVRYAGASSRSVAEELEALRRGGAEVLIVAGASALDPLDPVTLHPRSEEPQSAEHGIERIERHGAPAHPGSLLWVARWDGLSVLGMPTCGMFSQATTFDLVFPRILTGERVGNREVADLGHGGLLSRDSASRFPPYKASAARGELE